MPSWKMVGGAEAAQTDGRPRLSHFPRLGVRVILELWKCGLPAYLEALGLSQALALIGCYDIKQWALEGLENVRVLWLAG